MLNREELEEVLGGLGGEAATMAKLLTRNNNQHRQSKPHILLRTVSE
jgi:hypothetical protein